MRLGVLAMNIYLGKVVRRATSKTIRVAVDNFKLHPKLLTYYVDKKLLMVHDENEETRLGDLVLVRSRNDTTASSRLKRFELKEIVEPVNKRD